VSERCTHGSIPTECPVCLSGVPPQARTVRARLVVTQLDNKLAARLATAVATALSDVLHAFPPDIAMAALSCVVADSVDDTLVGDMDREQRLRHFMGGVRMVWGETPAPEVV